ncbi:MAG: J domain-containing protein [Spirochaetes bacterium]|nr:J domain-containing protein [Spirochaetota bacterium]
MNLSDCYRIMGIRESATDDEIKKSFKMLAHKYHPDKNPQRIEWANNAMSALNTAYTTLMQLRFQEEKKEIKREPVRTAQTHQTVKPKKHVEKQKVKKSYYEPETEAREALHHDLLTKEFVKVRESTKNGLYQYFQYGIYNIARRENTASKNIFIKITANIKKSYHAIISLKKQTEDVDFIKHFDVFSAMIYNFYMASECINVIDSYSDAIEVEAYRLFKRGDDMLHPCEKEIFYDRHNRGFFKKEIADNLLLKSEANFKNILKIFPNSTWAVETKIKLQYAFALKEYLNLFFSEYSPRPHSMGI